MTAEATVPLLELRGVTSGYGAVRALQHMSIKVHEHEFVTLLGPNGAGKTSTLRTISGLIRPAEGSVWFDGRDITRLAGWRRTGIGLGHVPEGRQIFPDQTVRENLRIATFSVRHRRDRGAGAMADVFDLFPRLAERASQPAGTLSGGEAQMLAVARALMSRPRLLMLDEPSLGLAPMMTAELFGYVQSLHSEQGVAILLVEQGVLMALSVADRGYVLERGHVVVEGPATELRNDPRVHSVYLGTSR